MRARQLAPDDGGQSGWRVSRIEVGRPADDRQKRGSIINIGSMSGRIVNWPFRHAAYNVSKAGVHMLTKCLVTEWAEHNIRVNAIAPATS